MPNKHAFSSNLLVKHPRAASNLRGVVFFPNRWALHPFVVAACFLPLAIGEMSRDVPAAPLVPDDPGIHQNLLAWFTDPASTYHEGNGIWTDSSGSGNDASVFVGTRNGLDFLPFELTTESPEAGLLAGQVIDVVLMTEDDDSLKSPNLNDELGFSELTIITLLRYNEASLVGGNRPVGIGSFHDDDLRPGYQLGGDGSIRKDNGRIDGIEPVPLDFFIRGSVLSGNGIDNGEIRDVYFDESGETVNLEGADAGFAVTADDRLYLGDLRNNFADNAIAQVAFYNVALTDQQVASIAEWMSANPNGSAGGGEPRLLAGDADQDFDFDQLDLVQVQISAKYLTGAAATWGQGDWDGAPGGSQGSPPTGDGFFNQLDIISALGAGIYLTGPYAATNAGGKSNDGQTSIIYNPQTGELGVDAPAGVELTSINIDSAAAIFTGQPAQNLGGSFDNDADDNLFKATFGSSFGSLSFGNVAQTGLSEDFVANDLTVVGSLAGGGGLGDVDLIYVPEPNSLAVLGLGVLGLLMRYRRIKKHVRGVRHRSDRL